MIKANTVSISPSWATRYSSIDHHIAHTLLIIIISLLLTLLPSSSHTVRIKIERCCLPFQTASDAAGTELIWQSDQAKIKFPYCVPRGPGGKLIPSILLLVYHSAQ